MIASLGVVVFSGLVQVRSRIQKSVKKGLLFQVFAEGGKFSIPMHFRLICFWWPLPLFVRFIWLIFTPREYEEMHELVLIGLFWAAGGIFDGWGGSRRGRDPEHTPVVCEESRRAGDRARRENSPAAPRVICGTARI